MFGTEEGASTPGLYSYFGGGLTLSAKGGHTFTLTGSLDDVSRGWNFAATVVAPTGHVAQVGWSGELSNPSTFFDDLRYGACEWAEAGVKLGGGAKLPKHIPKYLKTLDPKWLLKNSTRPKSVFSAKDWIKNASVSVTGFYVWGWDVFSGDSIDRNFAAAEMFSNTPSAIGLNTRNVMMAELLGAESAGW